MAAKLSPAQKKSLLRDGYVVVPGAVPPARVAAALREVNHRLGAGRHPNVDAYSSSLSDYLSERLSSPPLLDLVKGGPRELVESLLGPQKVMAPSEAQIALRFPSLTDAGGTPNAHIDWPGGDKDPAKHRVRYAACVGILLSDLPRPGMGNLLLYPGTHELVAAMAAKGGTANLDAAGQILTLPEPVPLTGKAGDLVLFHFQTIHAVGHNSSPHIRAMAYFRFSHVDAWYDDTPGYMLKALKDPWLEWSGLRGRA